MAHPVAERNPFMLMLHPEVIIAAVEKSERLGQLNRHLCRPLDRPAPGGTQAASSLERDDEDDAPRE